MARRERALNHYAVLGVKPGADLGAIKSAYRRLAFENHPDRVPDDPKAAEILMQVLEAYSVLGNPERRREYDEYRQTRSRDPDASYGGDFDGPLHAAGDGAATAAQSHDIYLTTSISFQESVEGTQRSVSYARHIGCDSCQASGSISGAFESCPTCEGLGRRVIDVVRRVHCSECSGKGVILRDPCRTCSGEGRLEHSEARAVTIRPGVANGERIRVAAAGSAGVRGAPASDLVLRIEVQPHPFFHRRDDDVLVMVPISYTQAVLGATIEVPGPASNTTISIPAGTPSGREFRADGLGFKGLENTVGDLVVRVFIHVPEQLPEAGVDLLLQLEDASAVLSAAHPYLREYWREAGKPVPTQTSDDSPPDK